MYRAYADNAGSHNDHLKDTDPTPRGTNEPWTFNTNLTPSVLDPDSHQFNTFADQLPGYYTPPTGNHHALMHSHRAGDLHTPGFNMGLNTPLSMPTSEEAMQTGHSAAPMDAFQFQPQMHHSMQQNQFHSMNPFQMHNQQAFAPQDFHHQHQHHAGPEQYPQMDQHMQNTMHGSDMQMDMGMQHESPADMMFNPDLFTQQSAAPAALQHPLMEK